MRIIVNADDFGFSEAVNRAVVKARRGGMLTSASLMVTGDAARDAVAVAKDDPELAVGLHLALSCVRSTMPRDAVPNLVDHRSRFVNNPTAAGLKYYFSRAARRQLRAEIEAQFEAFAETGLVLSHVDGHQHLHAHPMVLPTVVDCAIRFGAHGIRFPRESFIAGLRANGCRLGPRITVALGQAYLASVCGKVLQSGKLASADMVIGGLMCGRMNDGYIIRVLNNLQCGSVEVFLHPADLPDNDPRVDPCGPNPGDLRALLSPRLKHFMTEQGFELTNYAGLAREQAAVNEPR